MGCVVCATRGGTSSRIVQKRAIDYARKSGSPLIFLYVIDTSSLEEFDGSLLPAVEAELHWVGRILLGIAKKRAENESIKTEIVVRSGKVQEEIGRFLTERSADLLFLGSPRGTTINIFGDDAIEHFARSIEKMSGVAVEIVRPEDV
jgi:nucleotide-binding universal stress UspA family protein